MNDEKIVKHIHWGANNSYQNNYVIVLWSDYTWEQFNLGVMTDYEYLFSTNLHAKLKERIQGGIFVKVNENDSLVIKITRRDENNFDMSFTDFSNRMLNGFSTDYAAYEVTKKYQKFVMKQFFK